MRTSYANRNIRCLVHFFLFLFGLPISSTARGPARDRPTQLQCSLTKGVNPTVGVLNVNSQNLNYTIVETPDQPFTEEAATAACMQLGFIGFVGFETITSHGKAEGPIASINCPTMNISACELQPISDDESCSKCFRKASVVLHCYKEYTTVFDSDTRPTECILEGKMKTFIGGEFHNTCMNENTWQTTTNAAICIHEGLESAGLKYRQFGATTTPPPPGHETLYMECKTNRIEDCQWKERPKKFFCRLLAVDCNFTQSDVDRAEFCRNGMYHQEKESLRKCLAECPTTTLASGATMSEEPAESDTFVSSSSSGKHLDLLSIGLYILVSGLNTVAITAF